MEGLFGIGMPVEELGEKKGERLPTSSLDADAKDSEQHRPEGVQQQDGAPLSPSSPPAPTDTETLAEQIREKRWTVFVTKAADRYEKWWNTLPGSMPFFRGVAVHDFEDSASLKPSEFPRTADGLKDIEVLLPPLDVLMVWHAHMLNPRIYLEDCMRMGRHALWHTAFPWELLHQVIDNETFEYRGTEDAIHHFEARTGLRWDALEDCKAYKDGVLAVKVLDCPKCKAQLRVPWTRPSESKARSAVEEHLSHDTGFAGLAFEEVCKNGNCGIKITHETLRVAKFISDVSELSLWPQRPMPGTILNKRGIPQGVSYGRKVRKVGTYEPFFPHRVVLTLDEFSPENLRQNISDLNIDVLAKKFQQVMRSPDQVKMVNSEQIRTELVAQESRITVRKMFSHYWDNSSPFGIDVTGAVIRQGSFVQKMRKIDWLHSPHARTTMQRCIVKYHRFIRIIADHPKQVAVPTLDVDLAWVSSIPF
jgi:hypothetical protein